LDGERKGEVVRFLQEAKLIAGRDISIVGRIEPPVNLESGDVNDADLSGAELSRADLTRANLGGPTS
jgi:uncharacterized protein YjbI with pentapeptide repeats